ncbi:MAG TPA: enoyl-CoA hydratase/isomerase family protein [Rhodocyclaceae bacterium]|nr:enoyl-CoA hydratase/isomerase family protein [Rhodocyclaceae bacterium]
MTLVRLDREDAIGVLTLSRSEMHNALVPELLEAVLAALAEVAADPGLRALVFAAEGPAFSIGGDMRRFHAASEAGNLPDYAGHIVGVLNEVVLAMTALPQPIVAAVHGTVTGGSLGFLMGADLVVMAEDAVVKSHYASAGFCPDGGWTAVLPAVIGPRRAAEALLLNRSISAAKALEWGIVNALAAADDVLPRALEMACKIAAYPVGTMRHSKRLLGMPREELANRLEAERQGFLQLIAGAEARNGLAAFLQQFTSYPGGSGDHAAAPRPL